MGRYFNPPVGELEITPFYSNNEICWEELRFSVPIEKWSEFQNSQLFHDLEAYVADLQTQDTQNTHRTLEHTVESEASLPHSMQWDLHESFEDGRTSSMKQRRPKPKWYHEWPQKHPNMPIWISAIALAMSILLSILRKALGGTP